MQALMTHSRKFPIGSFDIQEVSSLLPRIAMSQIHIKANNFRQDWAAAAAGVAIALIALLANASGEQEAQALHAMKLCVYRPALLSAT